MASDNPTYEIGVYDDDESEAREDCWRCGGEGWVDDMHEIDPLWYDEGESYRCNCCGGSGRAEDCMYW